MNLFTITGLLVTIFCLILSIVIFKFASNRIHYIWGTFNLVVTLWSFGTYLAGISSNASQALFFWKLTYVFAAFISVMFLHLVHLFCRIKRRSLLIFAYVQALCFIPIIIGTNLFFNSTTLIFKNIFYHNATPLFSLFMIIWISNVLIAFIELYKFKNSAKGVLGTQSNLLFWGMLIGFIGGTSTIIPAYQLPFYPALQLSICLYALIMPFAIFRYRLMELTIIVKRSIVYSILVTFITCIFLITVLMSEKYFQGLLGYKNILFSILFAVAIALIFTPLKNYIQSFVDKSFYKGTPEEIAHENDLLRQEVIQKEKYKLAASLAGGIAHEIRNPLTALQTFCSKIIEKKDDPKFLQKFQNITTQELARIESLAKDLTDFAKPSVPSFTSVNVNKLIEETLDLVQSQLSKNNINLSLNISDSAQASITADKNQLKQALLNIILNAIDAMPEGGEMTVSTEHSSPAITIIIQDTGQGIADEDLKYIFEPFFSKKQSGTGLGLFITKSIIEKHSGKVVCKSKTNHWTEFRIELPKIKKYTEENLCSK
jgi:signal transduction histidine kinase